MRPRWWQGLEMLGSACFRGCTVQALLCNQTRLPCRVKWDGIKGGGRRQIGGLCKYPGTLYAVRATLEAASVGQLGLLLW